MMNLIFRLGYRVAYRLLQVWWFLRRPTSLGAAIAVWHGDHLLVVRTAYRARYDLPGGGVAAGEATLEAAIRELREETGLRAVRAELADAGTYRFRENRRHITAQIFSWRPGRPLAPAVDQREIVWAGYMPWHELMRAPATKILRSYLDALEPAQRKQPACVDQAGAGHGMVETRHAPGSTPPLHRS